MTRPIHIVDRIEKSIDLVNAAVLAATRRVELAKLPVDKKPIHYDWSSGSRYGSVYRYGKRIGNAISCGDLYSIAIEYRGQSFELVGVSFADLLDKPAQWAEMMDREAAARDQAPAPLTVIAAE